MLFDYTYNLILRTGQSPISSDNRRSTPMQIHVNGEVNSNGTFLNSITVYISDRPNLKYVAAILSDVYS